MAVTYIIPMLAIRLLLSFSITLIFCMVGHAQNIRINEVQASNTKYLDENGDTPDWIELHNLSSDDIILEGWSITDDLHKDTYWTFGNTILAVGNYLTLWASDKDRTKAGPVRSLVREDDLFRYQIPTQNQHVAWKSIGYNDDNWNLGQCGIGYGDGDDRSIVPNGTRSVFIRKEFDIANSSLINQLYLDIDYDDAFVAYINGVEIARDNIESSVPNFLSLANTDKEAKMYAGDPPDRFDISEHLDLLVEGENVLAIQVHNNVTTSSDMTLRPFLSARYNVDTQEGSVVPAILNIPPSFLHTDFKISSESETIYLIQPNGEVHDSIKIADVPTDISYGYTAEGNLAYFERTTPNTQNSEISYLGILNNDIVFSNNGGQVDALSLTLSTDTPFTSIRYTTDATEPTDSSMLYSLPINITSNTPIRAALFREGFLPSITASKNYIVGQDHLIPVMSLITDPVHLFDEIEGIYSYGNNFTNEFPFFGSNFWKDEERPIHIGYYDEDNDLNIDINAGIKIFGGWSRAFDQRSLSLFARKQYGPSNIEYPIFQERSHTSYGALVLRNAGNDNLETNIRDIINYELIKDLDLETQAYKTVATYINDEYWGMYHLREKVNEHFLANKYKIDPDSIDLLEFNGVAIHGNNEDYLALLNLATNGNISDPNVYDAIKARMDVDNFIDYYASQIYIDNTDWPGNNVKYWKAKDGKWRWILYDTDFGFNLFYEFGHFNNTLNFALNPNGPEWPNPPWSTALFRALVQNQNFRIDLVNRFADFMNSRYLTENILSIIDQKVDELQPEIQRHFIRWNGNMSNWANQLNRMRTFAELRPGVMKNHIRAQFDLPAIHPLSIDNQETEKGYVQISTLFVREENWEGDYFENNPFILRVIAKPGFRFSHWTGSINSSDESLSINISNAMTVTPHFEEIDLIGSKIVINEVNYKSKDDFDAGDWIELYNPTPTAIDLSNWIIKDEKEDNSFSLPSVTIASDEYLIIVAEEDKFETIHPQIDYIGELGFGLSSNDQVRLLDANGLLVDSVDYMSLSPWPILANGQGYTLELINPVLDNTKAENYNALNFGGSPDRQNILPTHTITLDQSEVIYIYPNPTSDFLNVSIDSNQDGQFDIQIIDALGRLVLHRKNQFFHTGKHVLLIDIKHLLSGNYQVIINNNEGQRMTIPWLKL